MKKIGVYAFRGGNGKTTIAMNLAYFLSKRGYDTLVVDLDFYAPAEHEILRAHDALEQKQTSLDYITRHPSRIEHYSFGDLIQELNINSNKIYVIPAALGAPNMNKLGTLVANYSAAMAVRDIIDKELSNLEHKFDFVIFDSTPGLTEFSLAMLELTDMVCYLLKDSPLDYIQVGYICPKLETLRKSGRVTLTAYIVNELLTRPDEHEDFEKAEKRAQNTIKRCAANPIENIISIPFIKEIRMREKETIYLADKNAKKEFGIPFEKLADLLKKL